MVVMEGMITNNYGPDQWVVVSIADNGVVHVWGHERRPFDTVGKAAAYKKNFIKHEKDNVLDEEDTPSRFVVCKILGGNGPSDGEGGMIPNTPTKGSA